MTEENRSGGAAHLSSLNFGTTPRVRGGQFRKCLPGIFVDRAVPAKQIVMPGPSGQAFGVPKGMLVPGIHVEAAGLVAAPAAF